MCCRVGGRLLLALRGGPGALALFLGAVIVLRAPAFAVAILDIDESDFALAGRMILGGAIPYADVVDIKPPLTYLAFLPAGLGGGVSLLPMRFVALAVVVATAMVLRRAAEIWTGDNMAGWAAAWLSLLAGLCAVP